MTLALLVGLCALAGVIGPATAGAAAKKRAPALTGLRCVPATAAACRSGVAVRVGRQIQVRGTRLRQGQRVTFRWSRGALATRLRRGAPGFTASVPPGVRPGAVTVTVRDGAGRRSNARKLTVLAEPKPVVKPATPPPATAPATTGTGTGGGIPAAFTGNGMWIWQLGQSDGGDVAAIAARAKAANVATVFIKAGDGGTPWAQFSTLLVGGLRQQGLRVCAWQFVYGDAPAAEAAVAQTAISNGADCFVIDAETRYEGKYEEAQTYMSTLRATAGPSYPIGLTSFPYVDYHARLPYSVFLGPGGAQVNLPQVYWKDIGGSVDAVSARTLAQNRIYGTPIAPLGQTYQAPSAADLQRFRQIWTGYGAKGLSWWSWQASSQATWDVLAQPAPAAIAEPDPGWPALTTGSKGDQVIWLQEHLTATYPTVTVTGTFDSATAAAVKQVQTAAGLEATGATDAATWTAALALPFTAKDWTAAAP